MSDDSSPTSRVSPQHKQRPPDPTAIPVDLKVALKEQTLRIAWQDGTSSTFPFPMLRKECPCALCRGEREEAAKNPLHVLKSDPSGATVVSANLVGNYAIQFHWSDGHNTGIYDFRMLKSLAQQGR